MFLVILFFSISCSSVGDEKLSQGSISGSVSDLTTGDPVSAASIILSPGGSSVITGSDGRFAFENLDPGEYVIEVNKEGYTSNSSSVLVKSGENAFSHLLIGRLPSSIISDKNILDFGNQIETLSFTIVNRGYKDLEYVIVTGNCEWLSVKPYEGTLKFEKTETIVVTLLRDKLPMGNNEAIIVVRSLSGDGNAEIKVTAVNGNSTSSVNTLETTDITASSAKLNGKVINIGEPKYTERGFIYSVNPTPTIEDNIQKLSCPLNDDPEFSCRIENLATMKVYYARAYVIQSGDVVYGNVISFSTAGNDAVISTSAVTDISATNATFNGMIQNIGAPPYSERGFCYSSSGTPSISTNKITVSGSGSGAYSAQVNNLEYPTNYNVCAYVIQAGKPIYGNVVSFSTQTRQPSVITSAVTDISTSSATFNGMISDLGIPQATRRGFCYSSSTSNPSISDDHWDDYLVNTANYNRKISGLASGVTYYVRAYAYQDGKYFYGNTVSFMTNADPVVVTGDPTGLTKVEDMYSPTWNVTLHGTVVSVGSTPYSSRGFVYDTTSQPTVSNGNSVTVGGSGTGSFQVAVTGLQNYKNYYVRAWVLVGKKYFYGDSKKISTY